MYLVQQAIIVYACSNFAHSKSPTLSTFCICKFVCKNILIFGVFSMEMHKCAAECNNIGVSALNATNPEPTQLTSKCKCPPASPKISPILPDF